MLFTGTDQKEGVDKVSMKEEYAVGSIIANSKKIRKLYHFNNVALEDLFVSVYHKRNCKNCISSYSKLQDRRVFQRQMSFSLDAFN